ncbi:MAG: hypothetical protein PUC37_07780 [Spirochaetales bacterium]|nr:hypothetical protein [Spirochaetales bacterium]
MKKITIVSAAVLFAVIFSSCKSTKQKQEYVYDERTGDYILVNVNENGEIEENDDIEYLSDEEIALIIPEATDDFIGDFDPIQLQSLMALTKFSGQMKPKELRKNFLVPRSNSVEFYFRDFANEICFILNYKERQKLIDAGNQFLAAHEAHSFKKHKVNKKTAYYNSRCSLWFGVLDVSTGSTKNDYFVNYDIIDKKAYMVISFIASRVDDDNTAFTPSTKLYFSPSQVKELIEVLNQDNLQAELAALIKRAYTYE